MTTLNMTLDLIIQVTAEWILDLTYVLIMEELFKKYLHRVSVQPLFIRLNGIDFVSPFMHNIHSMRNLLFDAPLQPGLVASPFCSIIIAFLALVSIGHTFCHSVQQKHQGGFRSLPI